MAKFSGVLLTTATGLSEAQTLGISSLSQLSPKGGWASAAFGVSMTGYSGSKVYCYVVSKIGAVTVPICGISGIASLTTLQLPIVNEKSVGTVWGSSESSFAPGGIPTPTHVVMGNSGSTNDNVKNTYSAVITAFMGD